MRKIITIIALAACACSPHSAPESELPQPVRGEAATVKVSGLVTRVAGVSAEDEAALHSLQVLVFNSDGSADAAGSCDGGSLSVSVTAGKGKRLWAIANAPDVCDAQSEEDLLARVSLLTDNSPDSFVMCGNSVVDILRETTVNISLTRLVARLGVKKITRSFDVEGLAARPLVLKGMYLINVAASLRYDGSADASLWLNRSGFATCEADPLLSERSLDIRLEDGGSYSVEHSFYCYPNLCGQDSAGGSWSPRRTRLVLEAELGGKLCYYSVTFPQILRNRTYTIENLTLSGKGSPTPDTPYVRDAFSADLTVRDWTDGSTWTERL